MPPLPNAPGVVRVALGIALSSTPLSITRFFIHYTGTAPSVADLTAFNASVNTAFGTNLKALLNSSSVLESVESVDLSSTSGAVATNTVATSGTRAGVSPTAETSMVTSYKIARRYRGGHPRGYWPLGVTADMASNRLWAAAFVTATNTGVNAFFAALFAAGWAGAGTLTQVNVSYFSGFTVITNPVTGRARNVPKLRVAPVVDTVTAVAARSSIGTQRRRNQYQD